MSAHGNPPPIATGAWRLLSIENPYLVPAFITLILVSAHLTYGVLESLDKTLLAIAAAIGLELLLGRIVLGRWIHPASAYITGISVGILVRSPAVWPYLLCSVLSILSKYVLRYKGRHLWNPSNFGIAALLFLSGESVGSLSIQWGNHVWAMLVIWALGAFIIWRLRRFHITATYVAAFIVFALLRSWTTGSAWQSEIAPITGPMYQLFIFFMITDPKTTVSSKRGQCIVVLAVALVESVLRSFQVVYAPYYALFMVGPAALLAQTWWRARKAAAPAAVPVVK
jgi:Na+-translocating ferredoxin:NAD+ oxidoreductase RnfD subunit